MGKEIKTSDLTFASFLLMNGLTLVGLEPEHDGYYNFVFEAVNEAQVYQAKITWNAGGAYVPVKAFHNALNQVKHKIIKARKEKEGQLIIAG